jgi:hypothetical protein
MRYSEKYNKLPHQDRMKMVLTFGFVFISLISGWAQKNYFVPGIELTTASNTTHYKLPGKQFYPIYVPRGSEFYHDKWEKGTVVLVNGDTYEQLYLKYNTLNDELLYMNQNTGSIIVIDKDVVSEFIFDKTIKSSPRFKKMTFDKIPRGDHYFEMLYEGKLQFVIYNRTIEEKTSVYKDRYGKLQVSDYELRPQYYVRLPAGNFEKVKLKRRSLLLIFRDNKKAIRKLLRTNKNNFRTHEQAIQAIKLIENSYYTK